MPFLDALVKRFKPKGAIPAGAVGAVAVGTLGAQGFIREPFMGAWQQNQSLTTRDGMLASSAVFACIDLISSDIAKLRIKSVKLIDNVWQEVSTPRFTTLLRKPNPYQTRAQFVKAWIGSKLAHGNAYVLLVRNSKEAVIEMHVLNPKYVIPLVAPSGAVFYQISMSPLEVSPLESTVVPARDIIHDKGMTSWHPLVGMSPIAACASAATLGNAIATNSAAFFGNAARPSGYLSAPGAISPETAERLKAGMEAGYQGSNSGRIMVVGDDLKFSAITMTGADSQTIEQLKWTAEDVARCFHVPGHKIGLDTGARTANSSAIYESMYYSDCLQAHIDGMELLLDDALAVPDGTGLRLDTGGLMRMDEAAQHEANATAVGAGYMSPNEARRNTGLAPVKGGETPYLQQQNFSLAALAERDKGNPLAQPAEPAGGAVNAPAGDSTDGTTAAETTDGGGNTE